MRSAFVGDALDISQAYIIAASVAIFVIAWLLKSTGVSPVSLFTCCC
jgi:hypothetical protein